MSTPSPRRFPIARSRGAQLAVAGLLVAFSFVSVARTAEPEALWVTADEESETPTTFLAGDLDADGTRDLRDVVVVLEHLFEHMPAELPCADAADLNDDGRIDLSDAVLIIRGVVLELHVESIVFECEADLTIDSLDCLDGGYCP